MEKAIIWASSWEPAVWAAIIAGTVALITTTVAWSGHRSTRRSAAEANSVKALEVSFAHLPKEIERLTAKVDRQDKRYDDLSAKVDRLQEEAKEREGLIHRLADYVRQLWRQLTDQGITPVAPPAEVAAELAAER